MKANDKKNLNKSVSNAANAKNPKKLSSDDKAKKGKQALDENDLKNVAGGMGSWDAAKR